MSFLACAGIVASFSVLHPFASIGMYFDARTTALTSNPTSDSPTFRVRAGQVVVPETKLQASRFRITVLEVSLMSDGRPVTLGRVRAALAPAGVPIGRLPFSLPRGDSLWIRYAVSLTQCDAGRATVDRLRIRYQELGLSLSQVITTAKRVTLICVP
jgi:hypothetical protein